jgi:cellulose biosynthesis protein BcsQ
MKKNIVICGHYGSGKTEFSLNLVNRLKDEGKKAALVDLDIANVYFRGRELREQLEKKGIEVFGSAFNYEITAELPALSARVRKPLENDCYFTVVDLGGNESGALIINQFLKYFTFLNHELYCVINANRPETETTEGSIDHIKSIQKSTGLSVTGLINNTHMLNYTTTCDIEKGIILCNNLSLQLDIPLVYNCYPEHLIKKEEIFRCFPTLIDEAFPMTLFMRPAWLNR